MQMTRFCHRQRFSRWGRAQRTYLCGHLVLVRVLCDQLHEVDEQLQHGKVHCWQRLDVFLQIVCVVLRVRQRACSRSDNHLASTHCFGAVPLMTSLS